MVEQLPSDSLLGRLRLRAATSRIAGRNVSLHPDQVIALVEIAEAANVVCIAQDGYLQDLIDKLYKLEAL